MRDSGRFSRYVKEGMKRAAEEIAQVWDGGIHDGPS